MSKQLKPTGATAPATTRVELSADAKAYALASSSPNTLRAYRAQIALWRAFASAAGIAAIPADPAAVANWLAERARAGQALGTLRTAVAALASAHAAAGVPFDTRAPAIVMVLAGVGRVHARAQRQAEPIRGAEVAEMLAGLGQATTELRDGAVLALGYVFGLRRSELVGLDLARHGEGDGWLEIGARSIDLVLVRSKTSGAGDVERVSIPRGPVASAVAAIERWIAAAGIGPGEPLVRRVGKSGKVGGRLDAQSIAHIIKRRVAEFHIARGVPRDVALAEGARFSAHSLRVGFAVTAAEAGASGEEIALVTRHRSLEMPRRYAAKADALRRSPYRREGVGTDPVSL